MSQFAKNKRAEASRRNGTKSRGPTTAEGKARASQNALKHGLCAQTAVLLEGEDQAAFEALDHGLKADLQPRGALEILLASRLAMAAWRMDRADRIEAELLGSGHAHRAATLGEKITRDRHGPQAIDCLIRYRGTNQAEFWRALAALRAVQRQKEEGEISEARHPAKLPVDVTPRACIEVQVADGVTCPEPNEPERR